MIDAPGPSGREAPWRDAWDRAGCHRSPDRPSGPKFFNYDSGPFPNGPLHMGHVRTYVLGDVMARYRRLTGHSVLYATEWDSFGLPNEEAALAAGASPREFTRRCIATMEGQLRRLGISYDWKRVRSTADPEYYRFTQALFVELFERGLAVWRGAIVDSCARCATTLARMQAERGACWRCGEPVSRRRVRQWFVRTSRYARRLASGLEHLRDWSPASRRLLRSFLAVHPAGAERRPGRGDWHVSRQRAWGTPIPIVHCPVCGPVAVPRDALPVLLPDDLDWSLGPAALAAHPRFAAASCPRCSRAARRETDTLDCFFDDVWCFLAGLAPRGSRFDPASPGVRAWMPVDHFHGGLDTFHYLHLHRFFGYLMKEWGALPDAEPIRRFDGHEMVLSGGRKMSTHLGNAVPPDRAIARFGADAVRLAVLWAARPARAVTWSESGLERAAALVESVRRTGSRVVSWHAAHRCAPPGTAPTRAARSLEAATSGASRRVARFIETYRPNAAVEDLARLASSFEAFVRRRAPAGRLLPADAVALRGVLRDYATFLSPFAPHLAEEIAHGLGGGPLVCLGRWPQASGMTGDGGGRRSRRSVGAHEDLALAQLGEISIVTDESGQRPIVGDREAARAERAEVDLQKQGRVR